MERHRTVEDPHDDLAVQQAASFPHAHGLAYRPEIDGLRAIAVGSVILYHAGIWPFSGGYIGVDVFFVISGFLISSIIISDLQRGRFTFANFYERRIKRIFPALFLVLACTTLGALAVLTPLQLREFGQALVATTAFASNIYFLLKAGYFNADAENNPLIHMWSLSVEEQFYLFFPVLLILTARVRWLRANWTLGIFLLVSLLGCLTYSRSNPIGTFFLTPQRAWELMAGALVAANRPRWLAATSDKPAVGSSVEIMGAALMLGPLCLLDSRSVYPGWTTIPVVVGTALIILASHSRSTIGRILALRPMVWIGLLSYSAYLWHQPVFAFARAFGTGHLPLSAVVALMVLTLVLSWLSWRFVEQPFRQPRRFSRRWLFSMALFLTMLFAAIGVGLHFAKGLPQRFDSSAAALNATAAPSPFRDTCHTDGLAYRHPAAACRYFGPRTTWATLGDSHSIELAYALAEDLKPSGEGLVHLSFSGCQPALKFQSDNPGCSAWTREAMDLVARSPRIRDVLLVYRHAFYLYGDQVRTYPALPNEHPKFLPGATAEQARAAYWTSFEALVRMLLAAGKRVHILAPIPELPVNVDRFIYGGGNGKGGATQAFHAARNAEVMRHLDRVAAWPGVSLIDPTPAMCSDFRCNAIIAGQAMYFDDNHLSLAGARYVVARERAAQRLP